MEIQRSRKDDEQVSKDDELPQCKIKRNYSCNHCTYFTQNPRFHLSHLRDIHGEKIIINKCNLCLYASRHYQKLVRHMKMVHGSTEGIVGQTRRRLPLEEPAFIQQPKEVLTPLVIPPLYAVEEFVHSEDLSSDLELSRNSLRDLAALYFAENQIDKIMLQMEESDSVQLTPKACEDLPTPVKGRSEVSSFFDEIKKAFIHERDLNCSCGHVSKCLSETVIHRRTCNEVSGGQPDDISSSHSPSESTTCQHCRRRCNSSADLVDHLKNCLPYEILQRRRNKAEPVPGGSPAEGVKEEATSKKQFLSVVSEKECETKRPAESPKKTPLEEEAGRSSFKKVFKCPKCSFWASTASRFHVHIVGHLNKKPFKCSLCTYRSNWRWDITKHIRLKSIRNPCHKSARVLMNDDTGRRNYTKYDKFTTLMKVRDEDGDSKSVKFGEMTPDQVTALERPPSDGASDVSMTESKQHLREMTDDSSSKAIDDKRWDTTSDGIEKGTPPLVRLGDDLILDTVSEGLSKKTFYKCRKCFFRHANRDAVLAHVRMHYQDPLNLPSPTLCRPFVRDPPNHCMNKDFAAAISLNQKPHADTNTDQPSGHGEKASSAGTPEHPEETSKNICPSSKEGRNILLSTPTSASAVRDATKSSMILELITSANFENNRHDRKVPLPFRCGHCHQVSNWKHVIQRHCRLKHYGHIRIEIFDRSTSDGRTPTYRPLDFLGNEQQRSSQGLPSDNFSLESPKEQQQALPLAESFKCPHCPYVAQNKTQLNFHSSLHKPLQFKCAKCSYICSKKQHLTNHMKVHENSTDPQQGNCDEVTHGTGLSKAKKCPEKVSESASKNEQESINSKKDDEDQLKSDCGLASKKKTPMMTLPLGQRNSCLDKSQDAKDSKDGTKISVSTTEASNPRTVDPEKPSSPKASANKRSPKQPRPNLNRNNATDCPHSPFKNECSNALQRHLQDHIRVSNFQSPHLCEFCDYSAPSKDDLNEHKRLHFHSINTQRPIAFCTSFDRLEVEKKTADDKLTAKVIPLVKDSKTPTLEQKAKKERIPNIRKRRYSSIAQKAEKIPSPAKVTHKTILVNAKTGQVIRRN